MGISLITTTVVFALILAAVSAIWYRIEKTLSIHEIDTTGREAFYWLTILFTFALGTAFGDLLAETSKLGYWLSAIIFGAMNGLVYTGYKYFKLNEILAFWIAYIFTRPLGASIGDFLSQSTKDGGLGLGTAITGAIFLVTILATVIFLTETKKDVID